MQSTTIINAQLGHLWKVMLVQLDDPRVERPYVLLHFGVGRPTPEDSQFELKTRAVDRFRELVFGLLNDAGEQKLVESAELLQLRKSIELAIQHATQVMH